MYMVDLLRLYKDFLVDSLVGCYSLVLLVSMVLYLLITGKKLSTSIYCNSRQKSGMKALKLDSNKPVIIIAGFFF